MTYELKPVRCGCGGEARLGNADYMCVAVYCMDCGTRTKPFNVPAEAVEAWNKAMSGVAKNSTTERMAKVDWINGEPFCPMCGDRLEWE